MAKVYIAAKYHRRFTLRYVANALRSNGHEVTSKWLDNGEEEAGSAAAAAQMDIDDVSAADTVLFFGEPHGSKNSGGGRWFELGLAFAWGKRCIVVLGPVTEADASLGNAAPRHETVFTSLERFECFDTVEAALLALHP